MEEAGNCGVEDTDEVDNPISFKDLSIVCVCGELKDVVREQRSRGRVWKEHAGASEHASDQIRSTRAAIQPGFLSHQEDCFPSLAPVGQKTRADRAPGEPEWTQALLF